MKNIPQLGQVFTPPEIVRQMFALRKNRGRVLEPSAGDGAFLRAAAKTAVGIEISQKYAAKSGALCMDFFDYPDSEKFSTIIGNPPYVRHQDIAKTTRQKLNFARFDRRTNLYLFFIEKCMRHLTPGGELILITPRDFLKATAAKKLNALLYETGTVTDYIELGDARIFAGVSPNCAVWRFCAGDFSRQCNGGRKMILSNGQISFVRGDTSAKFSQIFSVKVGAVSGMDSVFANEKYGGRDFVFSQTAATDKTRKMIYNIKHPFLARHKKELMARKIRRFGENNWWEWGRAHCESTRPRIYVNAKTRRPHPFFIHPAKDYDGAVLAVFPHDETADCFLLRDKLNAVNWDELGFVCGGRFLFGQRSLENCPLPESFIRQAAAKKRRRAAFCELADARVA